MNKGRDEIESEANPEEKPYVQKLIDLCHNIAEEFPD